MTPQEMIEKEVILYIEKNEVSPFANIEMGDEGQLNVDMDQDFENKIQEKLQEMDTSIEDALGEYFTSVIRELVEKLENEPQGIPEAP